MKRIVLAVIMLICISQYSLPQNSVQSLVPQKVQLKTEAAEQMNKLFPSGARTPYDVLNLPGIKNHVPDHFIARLQSTSYTPLKVTIDDTTRTTYTYNTNGYLDNSVTQAFRGGAWVNVERSANVYGPNDVILVYTTESWVNGQWKIISRQTMTYTPEGNTATSTYEASPDGIEPVQNMQRMTYTYDASGDMTLVLMEAWMIDKWYNMSRSTYTYNTVHRPLSYTMETWSGTAWQLSMKMTYTYDANNQIASMLAQSEENGVLKDISRYTYTYYSNGYPSTETYEKNVNGKLQFDTRGTYGFNGDQLVSYTKEIWSTVSSSFVFDERNLYTYQGDNMALNITEKYKNNAWVAVYKVESAYDANNNTVSQIATRLEGTVWNNVFKTTSAYDGKNLLWSQSELGNLQTWTKWERLEYKYTDGNAVEGKSFSWQNNAWTLFPGTIYMYFNNSHDYNYYSNASVVVIEYTAATGVEEESNTKAKEFSLSQNYPNPFNPSTTISYSLNKEGNVKLTIYDVLGTKVTELVNEFQPAGSHTVKFNAAGLSSGIYLYRLESSGMSATKKFTLLK